MAVHLDERIIGDTGCPCLRIDGNFVLVRDREDAAVEGPMHRFRQRNPISWIIRPTRFLADDVRAVRLREAD